VRIRAGSAFAAVRRRVRGLARTPAVGLALLIPLVLMLAVGASAPAPRHAFAEDGFTPLAAVARTGESSGVTVVAASSPPTPFRIAAGNLSAPPPAVVLSSVGSLRIPTIALKAYRNAERMMAEAYPNCGVSWNLLAGIGRIESGHANGGATDAAGNPIPPIYGPALDGTLPGNEVIVQNVQAGRVTYARALGPMQFLPGTWARYASDGKGDGKADVQNIFDATLGAARYLCSGNLNLRNQSQVLAAILRYNNSMAYAQNVLGWAAAYATGVEPVDLPPISGPAPPLGDAHLDTAPEGLGPGLPLNATGLPSDDPLSRMPLLGQAPVPGPELGVRPAPQQNCQVFCLTPQAPPPVPDAQLLLPPAPGLMPPPPAPLMPPPGPLLPPPGPLLPPPGPLPPPPPGPPMPPQAVSPAPGPVN
jgi:membrane-bound lytic murein transglycosylase B